MSKYVKYWLTPNQEARYEVHRMYGKDSLYYKAVTELADIEKPFDSPAWKAWCTSDAEFKDIVEQRLRYAKGSVLRSPYSKV